MWIWFSNIGADLRAAGLSATPWGFAWGFVFNSGFLALFCYRVYAPLWRAGHVFKLLGKIIERFSQVVTGCYLEPQAQIAGAVHFPHGVGIVIGAGVVVEEGVTIYQHVTLGRGRKDKPDAPKIEAGVRLYAGAVVAGDVVVKAGTSVSANGLVVEKAAK